MQRARRQVRPPAHLPDLVMHQVIAVEGLWRTAGRDKPRLTLGPPPENKLGAVRDKNDPVIVSEKDRRVRSDPIPFDPAHIGDDHNDAGNRPIGPKDGRGIAINPFRRLGQQAVPQTQRPLQRAADMGCAPQIPADHCPCSPRDLAAIHVDQLQIQRRGLVSDLKQQIVDRARGTILQRPHDRGMIRRQHGKFPVSLQLASQAVTGKGKIR